MKEFDKRVIANFIFSLIKYNKICKLDLEFAYDIFIVNEEYERCSVIKELIDMKYYDNTKQSELIKYLTIIERIETFDYQDEEMTFYGKKLLKLKYELMNFMNRIEEIYHDVIIKIPPFKNPINIEYFKNGR